MQLGDQNSTYIAGIPIYCNLTLQDEDEDEDDDDDWKHVDWSDFSYFCFILVITTCIDM